MIRTYPSRPFIPSLRTLAAEQDETGFVEIESTKNASTEWLNRLIAYVKYRPILFSLSRLIFPNSYKSSETDNAPSMCTWGLNYTPRYARRDPINTDDRD
jgi:hypothetical protein